MARKPDINLIQEYLDLRERHPDRSKSYIARLMGKDVRQIRRITNNYLTENYPQILNQVVDF